MKGGPKEKRFLFSLRCSVPLVQFFELKSAFISQLSRWPVTCVSQFGKFRIDLLSQPVIMSAHASAQPLHPA